jgi:CHAT domain-containing protein
MPAVNPLIVLLNFRKRLPSSAYRFFGCFILITLLTNQAALSTVDQEISPATRMEKAKTLRSEWRESSLREAISEYGEVERQSKATGAYEQAAEAARNRGDVYFLLGDYRNALEQYKEAHSLWRLTRNRTAEMQALNLVGYVHLYLGKTETGLKLASRALSYFRSSGRTDTGLAEAENCAGEANSSLGKLRKSIEHFERALELWTASNNKSGQALATLNIAYSSSDSGDIQKAQNLFTQSHSIYQELGDKRGEARALTGLGAIHSFRGEKQAALDNHLKAMNLLRTIGDHAGEAIALNNIGQSHEDLGNLPTALDNYNQALKLNQELGNLEHESATRYYIGRTYESLGDKQTALQFFTESESLSKQVSQRRVRAYALSAISAINSSAGQRTEAVTQLQQAVRLYRDLGDRRGQAVALSALGNTYHAMGHNGQALTCHKRAHALYQSAGNRHGEATALYDMAVVERALSDFKNALTHLKESNEAIEILRSQIVSPDLRASYYASVHKHAELYIDLLMRRGSLYGDKQAQVNAFEISEHTHARALLEILGEAAAGIKQGVNPMLLEQERVLRQKLNAKALYQMRVLESNAEPGERETVARDLRELTTSYRELQTQIKQQSPRYANLVQPQPLNLEQIQAELTDDTILLQFSLGTERSYLWALTKDLLTAHELPARDVVENLVKSVCESLVARQTIDSSNLTAYSNQVSGADLQYWKQAAQLSEMLLGPVVDRISGKTILVVADGALHYLPFEALPEPGGRDQSSPEPVPLIIDHEIVYLPSASILATIRQSPRVDYPKDKLIAILADPVFSPTDPRVTGSGSASLQQGTLVRAKSTLPRLPATKQEAEAIMAIIPAGTGKVATGFDADRTMALSAELGQYKVLHLATHGMVNVENPETSGIMFSLVNQEGKGKDGFVQLPDIYNLNLSNTRLVVLSACQTGLGKDVRGEGLVGLSRGFIYAGASTVVASLWKVDDRASSQLMTQFYKGMFEEGLTSSAALRKAKVNMWNQPRYRAPFYWAAFVLQGEYKEKVAVPPPVTRFPFHKVIFAIVAIITLGVLIIYVMRRRARSMRYLMR